jgi:hypothetical protein
MTLFERVRRWLNRSAAPAAPVAADPEDLHGSVPEDPAASTGLDRPFPASGPIAEPPVGDPPPADPPERPLG